MKAAALASAAPPQWREFMEAFRNYADNCAQELVQSPVAELQKMQGRAQLCATLARLMADAVKAAPRVVQKMAVSTNRSQP